MNRRDFIKTGLYSALALSLPIEFSAALTIVDIKCLDSIKDVLIFSTPHIDKNGQGYVNVTVDIADLWQHIRLVDDEGNEWYTNNEGGNWHFDTMSFSVAESEKELDNV